MQSYLINYESSHLSVDTAFGGRGGGTRSPSENEMNGNPFRDDGRILPQRS